MSSGTYIIATIAFGILTHIISDGNSINVRIVMVLMLLIGILEAVVDIRNSVYIEKEEPIELEDE